MPYFTIIANTETPILLISQSDKRACRLLAEFLTGDPNTKTIKKVQIATKELKERICLFDKFGDKTYKAKQFFDHIPTNHHFFFLPGRYDDRLQIFSFLKELASLDGTEINDPNMERIYNHLYEDYAVKIFNGNERINIGVFDKTKRVCRFCGRSMPDVEFKQKSHAISESLGNKNLICWEECDDCNHRFGKTIEHDIADRFRFDIILRGIKGKDGIPTMKSEGVTIYNDTSTRNTLGRDTLVLKVNRDFPNSRDPKDLVQFVSQQASFSCTSFVPQNLYKCFCKYVLSLVDSSCLPYFKSTIDWINEPLTPHRLPPIWHYQVPMNDSPSLVIMLRKNYRDDIPFCWAIISIAGTQYMFIVPFCSLDRYKFVKKTTLSPFLKITHNLMPQVSLIPQQMSGIKRIMMNISIDIEIPKDCVEGRDYRFIDPKTRKR